jgi:1-deoxy-D-xylulose-5-phosphate synthase
MQGMTPSETYALLDYAFLVSKHPAALRFSNGFVEYDYSAKETREKIVKPTWQKLTSGGKLNLVAYGDNARRMADLIQKNNLLVNLYNARFIKPIDEDTLKEILSNGCKTVVLEDVTISGGLGSAIFEKAQQTGLPTNGLSIAGFPDQFIEQGQISDILKKYKLDDLSLSELIRSKID